MLMNICHTLLDIVSFSIHLLSVHRPLLGPTVLPTHHVWVSGQILQLFIQNVELFNPQAESPCWLGLSIYFIDFTLHCAALTMHPNSVVISCIFTCKKRWSSVSSVKKYFQDDLWIKLFAQGNCKLQINAHCSFAVDLEHMWTLCPCQHVFNLIPMWCS